MVRGKYVAAVGILTAAVMLPGCEGGSEEKKGQEKKEKQEVTEESTDKSSEKKPEILHFVDVYGQPYEVEIRPEIEKHTYNLDGFLHDGYQLSYTGDECYTYRLGVDVSEHQGEIDWEKVKAAGYDFAFIRVGYRGYGEAGRLCTDAMFHQNIVEAQSAGIDVGVYFFAQAVNEAEAEEEADLVLQQLTGYQLQLPVVYDPESILDDEARTDNVSGEQFTKNTAVFCQKIKEADYQPAIYSNMLWEAYELDLKVLEEYPIWYADYELKPQTPYRFEFWQYTNQGAVDGIEGETDLNIQLIKQ